MRDDLREGGSNQIQAVCFEQQMLASGGMPSRSDARPALPDDFE
jgi:hypothetical protein